MKIFLRDAREIGLAIQQVIAAVACLLQGRVVTARGRFASACIAVSGIKTRYEPRRRPALYFRLMARLARQRSRRASSP